MAKYSIDNYYDDNSYSNEFSDNFVFALTIYKLTDYKISMANHISFAPIALSRLRDIHLNRYL